MVGGAADRAGTAVFQPGGQHTGGSGRDAADGRVAHAVFHVAAQLRLGLLRAAAHGLGLTGGLGVGGRGVGRGLTLRVRKLAPP